jgi:hypothetical protein
MPEWDWNNIANLYTTIKLPERVPYDPRIQEIENRMLDLIARIRKSQLIMKCKPGSAHQILTINPPGAGSTVHVVWAETGYSISIDLFANTNPSQQERTLASPEEVVSVLEDYIRRLEA